MVENLKIALKRQKKLIIIFLLTILLPSVSLSIFGIRAIRNERFRLAKQTENEHRRAADFLKAQINSRIEDVEEVLQNLAQNPAFHEKEYSAVRDLVGDRLVDNPLIDQVFIAYENDEPLFPLFLPVPIKAPSLTPPLLTSLEKEKLKRAEEYEFKLKKYRSALKLYKELSSFSKNKTFQAQMLNNAARCFMKLKRYEQAVMNYLKICDDYPECLTSSRLPLALMARLQIIECYQNLGDINNSLKNSLNLYRDICQKKWNLNEDQFKTYSSMAEATVQQVLSENQKDLVLDEYKKEFEQLKDLHQEKTKQWRIINSIKTGLIHELLRRLNQSKSYSRQAFNYSKTINDRNFLILAAMIPDKSGTNSSGILGLNIKNEYLENRLLSEISKNIPFSENTNIVISDLSGQVFYGKKEQSSLLPTITEFFEDNFPPWRMDFYQVKTKSFGLMDIRKSFYFWTIVTLIIVLIFGTVLIVRTIAQEMDVLKIKSDFVSSVSHEFKTPLTSIKALTERLQEGKVNAPAKMKQYFSVISQDTDKLTRLVRNILDFSKIEEGKKEYDFIKTDVAQLIAQEVKNFKKEAVQKGLEIHTQIADDVPLLSLDRDAISQALINLLDNAVKFSPDKKEIQVRVKRDEDKVIIEVEDEGVGIPQNELDKIFDKFYQSRSALQHSVKGTGLGLTLVKHIIEAHGGRISVESQVGQGSNFSLILPLKRK